MRARADARAEAAPLSDMSAGVRPRLTVERSPSLASGTTVWLESGMTIGRSRSSDLPVSDSFVSHMHARIFRRGQFHFIEDLGSTNGTFVNDRRITEEAQLKMRDSVRMGDTVMRYEE